MVKKTNKTAIRYKSERLVLLHDMILSLLAIFATHLPTTALTVNAIVIAAISSTEARRKPSSNTTSRIHG